MASLNRTLYVGVTSDLTRRVAEHRSAAPASFTARYRITRLVFYQAFATIEQAIAREKALKGLSRRRKVELIEMQNPSWDDLAGDW